MAEIKIVNPPREHPFIKGETEVAVDIHVTLDSNNQIVQIKGIYPSYEK
ncbi:MAG: hypothetical protein AAFX80_00210 [Cyanobacteria bacterium J06639_18]